MVNWRVLLNPLKLLPSSVGALHPEPSLFAKIASPFDPPTKSHPLVAFCANSNAVIGPRVVSAASEKIAVFELQCLE